MEERRKNNLKGGLRKLVGESYHGRINLLTYGGRYTLIMHVLRSIPICLMSIMNPYKRIMDQIHRMMAKLFWGNLKGPNGKHWIACDALCLPKENEGLILDPYIMWKMLILLNYGGFSEYLLTFDGVHLCKINIIKNYTQSWLREQVHHMFGEK